MPHPYRQLFTIPGAIQFSVAALIGRLPSGMVGLAIILPMSQFTGSYTLVGIVVACTLLGMAIGAPFSGRFVDRFGQRQVLLTLALLNVIATALLIGFMLTEVPLALLCGAAFISGVSRLSTGTMARTRWAYVTEVFAGKQHAALLQTAYAFESVLDEIVFIVAPIIATVLCTLVHPLAGLLSCLLTYGVGAVALALQRRTEPPVNKTMTHHGSAFKVPGLSVIFMATLGIGIGAGAVEVIIVARTDAVEARVWSGFLLALLALGSIVAGFWYGAQHFKRSAQVLWVRCLAGLVCALIPFALAPNLAWLAVALLLAGALIAPTSIAGQVLTERILPKSVLNEGMSMVVTAMILGMALGGWFAGILVDQLGVYSAGALPMLVTLAALLVAALGARTLRTAIAAASSG